MAVRCPKCGGIIPDVMFGVGKREDCSNHKKTIPDIDIDGWYGKKQLRCNDASSGENDQ